MKRGAGRLLQAALSTHSYANGGMAQNYADGGFPGFPKAKPYVQSSPMMEGYTDPGTGAWRSRPTAATSTQSKGASGGGDMQVQTPGYIPQGYGRNFGATATWTPQGNINDYASLMRARPQLQGQQYSQNITYNQDRGGNVAQGSGSSLYTNPMDEANMNAWHSYGVAHDLFPHDGGMSWGFKDAFLNPAVLAAVGGYAFAGAGATGSASMNAGTAGGTGSLGAGSGNFAAAAGGAGGAAGASGAYTNAENVGYNSYGGGYSTANPAPASQFGAAPNMSYAPGYGPGSVAAGYAAGSIPDYSSPAWQAQNSSQVPTESTQWADNPAYGQNVPQQSVVPGTGSQPPSWYDFGPEFTGGGYGGQVSPGGFGDGAYGQNPAAMNPNYTAPAADTPYGDFGGTGNDYANQSFNVDASYGNSDNAMNGVTGDLQPAPYQTNYTPMQAKPSVLDRVMTGAKQSVDNLPENFGKALPGMAASLGAGLIARSGGNGDNGASQYAQQQAQTDQARNQLALGAQKEFTANASKYGSDDYYRQMGDMSAMQFRSGRIQSRQDMQRQLAAQGKDPATINALLARYDNDTETGSVNARNSSYLAARNSGLGSQQAAAGMYGTGGGASTLSNINQQNDARRNGDAQSLANLISAPFTVQAREQGRASGGVNQNAADEAAKATTRKYGLGDNQYGR